MAKFIDAEDSQGNVIYINLDTVTYVGPAKTPEATSVRFDKERSVAIKGTGEQFMTRVNALLK